MIAKDITINARKFDGLVHRSWNADLISKDKSLLTFVGIFDKEVNHSDLGVIRRKTISYEYYWLDRWYNVFKFYEPNGDLRNYYCNINMPPTFENDVLDYVDLDIDILVWTDFKYKVLDQDEFEENSQKYNYSSKIIQKVNTSIKELESMIICKQFPFSDNAT